jgi:hypothetical protein
MRPTPRPCGFGSTSPTWVLLAALLMPACWDTDQQTTSDSGMRDGGPAKKFDSGITDSGHQTGPDGSIQGTADAGAGGDAGSSEGPCPTGSGCTLSNGGAGSCCDGTCVDLSGDPRNCLFCGLECPTHTTCSNGHCIYASCADAVPFSQPWPIPNWPSNANCALATGGPGTCCNGDCTDPTSFDTDSTNCGGCGVVCPQGESCTQGECRVNGPACGAGGSAMCPSGYECYSAKGCVPSSCTGLSDGSSCPLQYSLGACCAGVCVDVSADRSNCGGCGNACPSGQGCTMSACYALPACGTVGSDGAGCVLASGALGTCCGNTCADTTTDTQNCGTCGIVCPAGASCVTEGTSGECGVVNGGNFGASLCQHDSDCPSGTRCYTGGDPYGFCARLDCPAGSDDRSCYLHSAYVGLCCGGSCVDPTADPNCGGCGVACASGVCANILDDFLSPVPVCLPDVSAGADCSPQGGCPAGETCVGDTCVANACSAFGTFCLATNGQPGLCCGLVPSPPACADPTSDPNNCGACNNACTSGQSCVRGRCQ